MTCVRCQHQDCKRFGYFGKRRVQRWRCQSCKATFSEPVERLESHYTDIGSAARALELMMEGMSVRAVSRITGSVPTPPLFAQIHRIVYNRRLPMDLSAIQSALRERNIDAWLFYDHHHRDPIAYRVLGLPDQMMVTRRWFYLIPAQGEPIKLVHKIEAGHLDSLPGGKRQYSGWQELFDSLKSILGPYRDIAMQYSPNNIVFTISLVDGGTIDLLRGLGKNVVSSADLVAQFEATWSEEQIKTHFAARDSIDAITAAAFKEIGRRVRNDGTTEYEIQQWFMEAFRRENLVTDDPPIVAVNANAGNPHYEPRADHPVPIRSGDLVLIDVWGKKNTPASSLLRHHVGGIRRQGSYRPDAPGVRSGARCARCGSKDGGRCG